MTTAPLPTNSRQLVDPSVQALSSSSGLVHHDNAPYTASASQSESFSTNNTFASTPSPPSTLGPDTIPDTDSDTDLDWQRTLQEFLQPVNSTSKQQPAPTMPNTKPICTPSQTSRATPTLKSATSAELFVEIPVTKKILPSPIPIKAKPATKVASARSSPAVSTFRSGVSWCSRGVVGRRNEERALDLRLNAQAAARSGPFRSSFVNHHLPPQSVPTIIIPVKEAITTCTPTATSVPDSGSPSPLVKQERKSSDPDVEGTTCHRCSRKLPGVKMSCTSSGRRSNEACTLRFCRACVTKHFPFPFDPTITDFVCPKCTRTCNCTRCKKRPTQEASTESGLAGDESLSAADASTDTSSSQSLSGSTVFIRGGQAVSQQSRSKTVTTLPRPLLPSGLVGYPSMGKRSRAGSLLWTTGAVDLASSDVESSGDESDSGGNRPTKRKNSGTAERPETAKAGAVSGGHHNVMPCGIVTTDPLVVSMAALEGHFGAMASADGVSHPQFSYGDGAALHDMDMDTSRALEWLAESSNYNAQPSLGVEMDMNMNDLDFAAAAAAAVAATAGQFDSFGEVYGGVRPSPFKVDHVHFSSASSSSYSLYDYDGGWSPDEGSASASTAATSISGRAMSDSLSPGPSVGLKGSMMDSTSTLQDNMEELDEGWKDALCDEALRDEDEETEMTVVGDDEIEVGKKDGLDGGEVSVKVVDVVHFETPLSHVVEAEG